YLIDTHTHADHFSATHELARRLQVPVVMHRASPAPFVDMRLNDGDMLVVGKLRLRAMHTPGHTRGSMCPRLEDRLLTGGTPRVAGARRGRRSRVHGCPRARHESAPAAARAHQDRDPGAEPMTTPPHARAKDAAALRQQTGAGMIDCKRGRDETEGDVDRATE